MELFRCSPSWGTASFVDGFPVAAFLTSPKKPVVKWSFLFKHQKYSPNFAFWGLPLLPIVISYNSFLGLGTISNFQNCSVEDFLGSF